MHKPSDGHHVPATNVPPPRSPESGNTFVEKWAEGLLRSCAKAIADNDSREILHHLWMLNELSSPYGDVEQKLAYHFLQALFCKTTCTGCHRHRVLALASEKNRSFEAVRKVMLRFQELSPWMTFGHVASNGAILEAFEGETRLHIIDIGNTYCTQYPNLLESLATRANDTAPHVRLTVAVPVAAMGSVMAEVGRRLERFATLMGVPLEFNVVKMGDIGGVELGVGDGEAVAVNCSGTLRWVEPAERDAFLGMVGGLRPKVVTVVEEEADLTSTRGDFVMCFEECLRFYSLYFNIIEESFDKTSDERLVLEGECSRSIVGVLAGDGGGERRERGGQWCRRLTVAAFSPAGFSEDVAGDVDALLRRYRAVGWSVLPAEGGVGLYLVWKNEPVVWASAWKI